MTVNELEYLNDTYSRRINDLRVKIAVTKERNNTIEKLRLRKDKLQSVLSSVESYWHSLSLVRTAAINEATAYQTRRIEYLNQLVSDALREIFPTESYSARVIYDYHRKDEVHLELVDSSGNVSSPTVGQGQLMQYVISFAAISGITKGLGFNNVFIDEAFGVAAVGKLSDIGEMIDKYVKDGMQIILVAQNSLLYSSIPHRVIKLQKDPLSGVTEVVGIEDY